MLTEPGFVPDLAGARCACAATTFDVRTWARVWLEAWAAVAAGGSDAIANAVPNRARNVTTRVRASSTP
jgi:hypothetical protein